MDYTSPRANNEARVTGGNTSRSLSCPRERVTPVLSSYPIMYPEQTTPIALVTPIPLLKWTGFPPQARVESKRG